MAKFQRRDSYEIPSCNLRCGRAFRLFGHTGGAAWPRWPARAARLSNRRKPSTIVHTYDIALGFQPLGHKQFEGDGKTPEGTYLIDRRNPNSAYHLSVGVSYPNANDRINALANGRLPGGDIFIHGDSKGPKPGWDWTAGCIAVTDAEIEDIYAMIRDGTVIQILP
jgi:murein L,D-transpeptidase YafK